MGKALLCGGSNTDLSGSFSQPCGTATGLVTESQIARPIRIAGVMSNFAVSINATGSSRSATMRKNSANATLTVNLGSTTQQTVYDNSHTDSYAVGNTMNLTWASDSNLTFQFVKAVWNSGSGHVCLYSTNNISSISDTSTRYIPISGNAATSAPTAASLTEADAQCLMRASGTFRNMAASVSTASTTTATSVLRINGATGNSLVTMPASTTGFFEDTTHTDTFADGDLLNYQLSGHSTGWAHVEHCHIVHSVTANEVFSGNAATVAFSASDQFWPIGAGSYTPQTTESIVKLRHGFDGSMRNFRVRVLSNARTGTTTLAVRKNGADGNNTLSIGSSATGRFEDTTSVDSFTALDDINFVHRGGTANAIGFQAFMITEAPTMPAVYVSNTAPITAPAFRAVPVG